MQHIHDHSRSKPNPSQNQTKPDFYVIGDVQGCAEPLARLLAQIPAHADVWFCGDLINRGPDNLGVLRQVQALGSRARVILGNHDIHLLGVAAGVRAPGRSDTLDDILLSPDCEGCLNWLRQWPLAHFEHGILMVHAGVMPQWSLKQVLQYSDEAHTLLASDGYVEHLKTLFGSSPNYWKNSLCGAERTRAIINAFTRMRVCAPDGTMDFQFKGEIGDVPDGLLPWFRLPQRKTADQAIVFGHWSALGLHCENNTICLDTGCVWGQELTAYHYPSGEVISVPAKTR
ncbi:MAG: symmetrical bis(5'-nucleosyl)-tetraphosphatase [Burkholderiaceae bacterium]